jgi:hypothetical protein
MAAALARPYFVPGSLVRASFPFTFPVYVSYSPISLTRWPFSVTAALGPARNSHSTVQVRCHTFLPSFHWIAILAFLRIVLFSVQFFCHSLHSLRLLEAALSQKHDALCWCRINFGEEWLQRRHFASLCQVSSLSRFKRTELFSFPAMSPREFGRFPTFKGIHGN